MGTITKTSQKPWTEANKPDSYVKGDEFEDFVRKYLFPISSYNLLHKTHDYAVNKDDFVASSKKPDFKFRARASGREFYVEAKYRSNLYKRAIDWCKFYQLKRYHLIDRYIPVIIAIGIGGQSMLPEHVFLIPVKCIKDTKLYPSFLRKYELTKKRCVTEKELSVLFC